MSILFFTAYFARVTHFMFEIDRVSSYQQHIEYNNHKLHTLEKPKNYLPVSTENTLLPSPSIVKPRSIIVKRHNSFTEIIRIKKLSSRIYRNYITGFEAKCYVGLHFIIEYD